MSDEKHVNDEFYKESTVLVVDDEESLRNIIKLMIKPHVGKVLSAANGFEALEIVEKEKVNAMILDIHMPKMSGLQVLEKVSETNPKIAVIILTGFGDKEKAVQALKLHAFDFLDKPCKKNVVIDKVKAALDFVLANKVPNEEEIMETLDDAHVVLNKAVTQQQKLSQAMTDANVEMEQVFNASAMGTLVVDSDFEILKINDSFLNMFGLTKDDIPGKKCYEVLEGPACYGGECPMNKILSGDPSFSYSLKKVVNGRGKIKCNSRATPFSKPNGEVIGIIETFVDLSLGGAKKGFFKKLFSFGK